MRESERIVFLLGALAANFGLFLKIVDCRRNQFPEPVDQLLLAVAIVGIAAMCYGYLAFHCCWNKEGEDAHVRSQRALISSIQQGVNSLLFLYPGAVVVAHLMNLEFDSSPMPVGIVGMAGGTGMILLGKFLFREEKKSVRQRDSSEKKE